MSDTETAYAAAVDALDAAWDAAEAAPTPAAWDAAAAACLAAARAADDHGPFAAFGVGDAYRTSARAASYYAAAAREAAAE